MTDRAAKGPDRPGLKEIVFSERDEAEAYLSGIAQSISGVDFGRDDFRFSYIGGRIGECALHRGATSAMSYRVDQSGEFHFLLMQSGGARISAGRRHEDAAPRRSGLLLGPSARGECQVEEDSRGISLLVEKSALVSFAERLIADGRPVEISEAGISSLDLADPYAATLSRYVSSVFHEMQMLARTGMMPLAVKQLDELLLGLTAGVVSPTLRRLAATEPAPVGSAVVRRARDYIEANAADHISFADLAARVGVSARSLQLAFRRELGCSPRDFLTRCRLERGRARLLSAGEGETVTQIALAAGFNDVAAFARKYQQTFGERPSATLRRR